MVEEWFVLETVQVNKQVASDGQDNGDEEDRDQGDSGVSDLCVSLCPPPPLPAVRTGFIIA